MDLHLPATAPESHVSASLWEALPQDHSRGADSEKYVSQLLLCRGELRQGY